MLKRDREISACSSAVKGHVSKRTYLAKLAIVNAQPPAVGAHDAGNRVGTRVGGHSAGLRARTWRQRSLCLHEHGKQRHGALAWTNQPAGGRRTSWEESDVRI